MRDARDKEDNVLRRIEKIRQLSQLEASALVCILRTDVVELGMRNPIDEHRKPVPTLEGLGLGSRTHRSLSPGGEFGCSSPTILQNPLERSRHGLDSSSSDSRSEAKGEDLRRAFFSWLLGVAISTSCSATSSRATRRHRRTSSFIGSASARRAPPRSIARWTAGGLVSDSRVPEGESQRECSSSRDLCVL